MGAMRKAARAAWAAFDIKDVFAFGGLAAVAWGLWLVFEPAAFIVTGAVLFWMGAIRPLGRPTDKGR